jgi:two-component system NtrC family sensor kinase
VKEYPQALRAYLAGGGEAALSRAYELGRAAVASGVGVVELVLLHHAALSHVAPAPLSDAEGQAATFLAESMSSFELTHRGFQEAATRQEQLNRELQSKNEELEETARSLRDAREASEEANRELKRTQAQLVHSAKMASLGELVAGVAHEINNPLAFALSHLGTVQKCLDQVAAKVGLRALDDAGGTWSRALDRLREINTGLERIADLVVRLRTFSRLDEGERKTVSMLGCIESVLTILGHRLTDRIDVVTRFGEPDLVECYPSLLTQAIMNLVSNAIDSIEDRGTVIISTGAEGDSYTIVVCDTGSGIPEVIRDRVLEPFFTTKPVGRGVGLGLSITYSIVKKHGGELELYPAPEGGTVAVIRFPRALASEREP